MKTTQTLICLYNPKSILYTKNRETLSFLHHLRPARNFISHNLSYNLRTFSYQPFENNGSYKNPEPIIGVSYVARRKLSSSYETNTTKNKELEITVNATNHRFPVHKTFVQTYNDCKYTYKIRTSKLL